MKKDERKYHEKYLQNIVTLSANCLHYIAIQNLQSEEVQGKGCQNMELQREKGFSFF